MKLLLDTSVAIYTLIQPQKIDGKGRHLIADPSNDVYVSAVNIWEIAIKHALGRASAPPLDAAVALKEFELSGFSMLNVVPAHAAATQTLELWHRDPFDRLLVAQAMMEHMTLLTQDGALLKYSVSSVLHV